MPGGFNMPEWYSMPRRYSMTVIPTMFGSGGENCGAGKGEEEK